jgi:hypothetical protein
MKNNIYSLFVSHLIPKLSHFLYLELWRHMYKYQTWDSGNNKKVWYLGDHLGADYMVPSWPG